MLLWAMQDAKKRECIVNKMEDTAHSQVTIIN